MLTQVSWLGVEGGCGYRQYSSLYSLVSLRGSWNGWGGEGKLWRKESGRGRIPRIQYCDCFFSLHLPNFDRTKWNTLKLYFLTAKNLVRLNWSVTLYYISIPLFLWLWGSEHINKVSRYNSIISYQLFYSESNEHFKIETVLVVLN